VLVAVGVGFALALLMAGPPRRRQPQHWRDYWDRGAITGTETGTGSLLPLATIDRMYKQVR
jgi:hypothetical protein